MVSWNKRERRTCVRTNERTLKSINVLSTRATHVETSGTVPILYLTNERANERANGPTGLRAHGPTGLRANGPTERANLPTSLIE